MQERRKEVTHANVLPELTVDDMLHELLMRYPDRKAIISEDGELSFSELYKASVSVGEYFLRHGLKKGDHLIFQMPNCIEFVAALFAMCRIGVIPVMMLPAHGLAEITGVCGLVSPTAYIYGDELFHNDHEQTAKKISALLTVPGNIFTQENIRDAMEQEYESYTDFAKPSCDDIAFLLLSGGTTGIPKMIPRTHADYIYCSRKCAERCELDEDSVFLAVLPCAHNFPLGAPGLFGTLQAGGCTVISPAVSPMEIFECVSEYGVTFFAVVPAMLELCLQYREDDSETDISTLDFVIIGGAMLPRETAHAAERIMGCTALEIFGTAEGLLCCHSPSEPVEIRLADQGRPVSEEDEIIIVSPEGEVLPCGSEGEMITRGPYTIKGYYRNPEANSVSFTTDGCYRTGDLAVISKDGCIRLTGRAVEQINRAGEKIMPSELEGFIRCYPNIIDVSVTGIPDPVLGSRIAAFVLTEDHDMDLAGLNRFLKEQGIADYKLPDVLVKPDGFPLTAVGKVNKKRLREMYFEQEEKK